MFSSFLLDLRMIIFCSVLWSISFQQAVGQNEVIKNFGPKDLEQIIEKQWKKEYSDKRQPYPKREIYYYKIKNSPFEIDLDVDNKYLLIQADIPKPDRLTLVRINEWNRRAFYSRAYQITTSSSEERVRFEVWAILSSGVTQKWVVNYFKIAEEEFKEFRDFIGN